MNRIGMVVAALALLLALPAARATDRGDSAERREMAKAVQAAATKGDPRAQLVLGTMYLSGGLGVRRNYGEAAKWLEAAAGQGNMHAAFLLGELYLAGKGEPKDAATAAGLIGKAAEAGDAAAMGVEGELHEFGLGMAPDLRQAAIWYGKAVAAHDPRGEARLGTLELEGRGVARDPAGGVRLLRDAAEWGDPVGMTGLAAAYLTGTGIGRDYTQAYIWALRGKAVKDKQAARLATQAALRLSAGHRDDAEHSARDWSPRRPGESDAMAALEGRDDAGPARGRLVSTGSGFFVNAGGALVTNHHVIEGCARLAAGTVASGINDVTIVADDRADDLAVLQASRPAAAIASLREGDTRQAESVLVYGFPLVGELSTAGNATLGYVTALAGMQDDARFLQISAPLQPGNSGGPVVDASGNVVGIARAVLVAGEPGVVPQNVNFAIKASVLRALLDAHKIAYAAAGLGAAKPPADLSDQTRGFTVLVACYQ